MQAAPRDNDHPGYGLRYKQHSEWFNPRQLIRGVSILIESSGVSCCGQKDLFRYSKAGSVNHTSTRMHLGLIVIPSFGVLAFPSLQ